LPNIFGGCAYNSTDREQLSLIQSTDAPTAPPFTYALVVKDITNPYMIRLYEGFSDACEARGARARLAGPGDSGGSDQAQIVRALVEEAVDAIAIAANDSDALSESLQQAIARGIPVVSLDSTVRPQDRMVHIQQASPEIIGRVLIQASAVIMGQKGDFAILSTTPAMPNQAAWVKWMLYEQGAYSDKYRDMRLVEVAYGLDAFEASAEETRRLLRDWPELKLIVAPTVVGLRAAAETIAREGADVKVTGLGLPSDMEPHIKSGLCPWMYLWNPSEVGSLAAYALDALKRGTLTGAVGEIVYAGELGDKVVTPSEDGGAEIVLGNPKMFDPTNIMLWKEVF
jgi:rhamnose transport system substrate-binding protein